MRSSEQGLAYIKWLQSSEGQGLGELRGNGKLPHPVRQGQERPLQGQHLTCTLGHQATSIPGDGEGEPRWGAPGAPRPSCSRWTHLQPHPDSRPGRLSGPYSLLSSPPLEIVTRSCSHFLTPHLFLILCNLAPAPGTAETLLSLPAASEPRHPRSGHRISLSWLGMPPARKCLLPWPASSLISV